jgi:hypothetical protein
MSRTRRQKYTGLQSVTLAASCWHRDVGRRPNTGPCAPVESGPARTSRSAAGAKSSAMRSWPPTGSSTTPRSSVGHFSTGCDTTKAADAYGGATDEVKDPGQLDRTGPSVRPQPARGADPHAPFAGSSEPRSSTDDATSHDSLLVAAAPYQKLRTQLAGGARGPADGFAARAVLEVGRDRPLRAAACEELSRHRVGAL